MPSTKSPHPADIFAGQRLKSRRNAVGMSQQALGQPVGVTFQQIQKYESGANRMGVSRVCEFAGILQVPPCYFFPESEMCDKIPNSNSVARVARRSDYSKEKQEG